MVNMADGYVSLLNGFMYAMVALFTFVSVVIMAAMATVVTQGYCGDSMFSIHVIFLPLLWVSFRI